MIPPAASRGVRRAALLAACVAVGLAGCGYKTRRRVEEPGVSSIAVEQFDVPIRSEIFRRDLEMRLTKLVAEEVRARTPWRLETPARADAILSGALRAADTAVLAERGDPDRTPIVKRWRVEVECRLTERSSGRTLRTWTVTARQEFAPGAYGESEDASATDGVLRSIALDVVAGLERPVEGPSPGPVPTKRAVPPSERPFGIPSPSGAPSGPAAGR